MSFLDDLRRQAQARQAELHDDHAAILRNKERVEAACALAWRYFEDLARQLQILQPQAAARYVLDSRVVLQGLHWSAFAADVRKERLRSGALKDQEVVAHVVLSARLASGRRVELAKDFPPEMERLHARLQQAGIHCVGEPRRDPADDRFIENRYAFDADVAASVRVLPRHDEGTVQFVVTNLDGLATVTAIFDADDVTPARLDELARWWMGEPHRFLDGAKQVRRHEPR